MNVRVENSNVAEITRASRSVEIKGTVAGTAQETNTEQVEKDTGMVTSLQQTRVETSVCPADSQIEKIQQDAENAKTELIQQKMEVVSNTMSEKDCEEMGRDGFSVNGTEVETIVTEIDKIKMELAKAGVDISVFGDELSMEQLEALAGNAGMASQLASALRQADLPATEENISDCMETMQQAAGLGDCSDEMVKYLLEHNLPPTVENLYKAQYSTSYGGGNARTGAVPMDAQLRTQIGQVIERAGLSVNEDTLNCSQWMIENEIPLTEENLRYAMDLKELQLPPEQEQLAGAMLEAVAEGNRPMDAMVLEGYSSRDRAQQAAQTVSQATDAQVWDVIKQGLPLTIENLQAAQNAEQQQEQKNGRPFSESRDIPEYAREDMEFLTAKRQLEETRLMMTAQANYALLKQGISIETKPLAELVEQLKSMEDQYYKSLLSQNGIPATAENTEVFAETMGKTRELAEAPASVLGKIRTSQDGINTMHETGRSEQAKMERAGEAYETLRTEPRKDMGDSIQKAFRNVDDILKDIGMETTEANQRAVRILAYNQMEINPESIAGIKAADQKVQNMFRNLSPAVVMEMIREGVNPLELNVEQLNSKAQEIKNRMADVSEEKFSKYLWKLEQNQQITPEERDSYIGIYRLLNQIDKTDGAVIGALVQQGADLTMNNLLSAVRTNRNPGINVSVDDNFGEADEVHRQELSISEQIEAAYQTDCAKEALKFATPEGMQQAQAQKAVEDMTPEELLWQLREAPEDVELEEAYYQQQMEDFSEAKTAEAQFIQILTGYDMPVTAYNILAANRLLNPRGGIFKSLFDKENIKEDIDFEEVKTDILEKFGEAVKTPEDMAKSHKKLAETAENVMKTMVDAQDVSSRDLRDMKIMRQQIALGIRMAKEEHYAIPVLVADELTNVQLKIVRGKEEKGKVDVLFETPKLGKVAARFQVQADGVKGYIASDSLRTIEELKRQQGSMKERFDLGEESAWTLDMIHSEGLDLNRFAGEPMNHSSDPDVESKDYQVQTKTLYGIARGFLEDIKEMGQRLS